MLDKLVPGYYHRRTEGGDICASCCCNNVATEHRMAERLIIDDITHWARTYKVPFVLATVTMPLPWHSMKALLMGLHEWMLPHPLYKPFYAHSSHVNAA